MIRNPTSSSLLIKKSFVKQTRFGEGRMHCIPKVAFLLNSHEIRC
uniref:Uncharacterized protein n=1 Tax=Anguilla anguilla TaxID=7936 RepID=A0A0E9WI11_ANGAN